MALTNAFFEALNGKNIRRIRIMMKDSLLVDPTFAEYAEMEKAAASLEGLYDAHDGRELIEDKSQWNDDYMDTLMVQVVNNFSHERLEHLKKVVRYLNPVKENPARPKSHVSGAASANKSGYQKQKERDQKNGSYLGAKIATGAVAGAVVGGVIASAVGATVIGGVVVGGVVGGSAVTLAAHGGR